MSSLRSPLRFLYGEYHVCECAFMSRVTILHLSFVRWVKVFVNAGWYFILFFLIVK